MAVITEQNTWTGGVRQIDISDPIKGGPNGPVNLQAGDVANRTQFLKSQLAAVPDTIDSINGEVVPSTLADKLNYLSDTKAQIAQSITAKGVSVPQGASFRQYVNYLSTFSSMNVSNVINENWFNPNNQAGGISWIDPPIEFDHIHIDDLLFPSDPGYDIQAGVQHFNPTEGSHKYIIKTAFANGAMSDGVQLQETVYTLRNTAELVNAVIGQADPRYLLVTFNNSITVTQATGFKVSVVGQTTPWDALVFDSQPDSKSIRFKLNSIVFQSNTNYYLNYDGSGDLLNSNNTSYPSWTGFAVQNYSTYSETQLLMAQIPSAFPNAVVLLFSRAVKSIDRTKFTLNNAGQSITGLVSPTGTNQSVTVQLALSGNVSSAASGVTISMSAGGATDDLGQSVTPFTNQPCSNNSGVTALTPQAAEISASNPSVLSLIMSGAVLISNATSGSSAPTGWSLSGGSSLPSIASWAISDGTMTFTLSGPVLQGSTVNILYDGSDPTFVNASNGDMVPAFNQPVVNNSTLDVIPPGTPGTGRNLALLILGREVETPADVTTIINQVSATVRAGMINNLELGDYFGLASLTIAAGSDTGGAFSQDSNVEISGHGRWLDFMIVSKNGLLNKNGNTTPHVIFHSRNVLSAMTSSTVGGHYMEVTATNANGYMGSKGRTFLLNQVKAGLEAAGIPFSSDKIITLSRRVANKGQGATGLDVIADKLWLPTEWELFGANTYSWSSGSQAETGDNGQGRLEYYQDNASRLKYCLLNVNIVSFHWWGASPARVNSDAFCHGSSSGSAVISSASLTLGVAPAFAVD